MNRPRRILLVEDNPGDVRLLQEAFRELNEPYVLFAAKDGEEALNYVHQRYEHSDKPVPDLILLDINLPKVNGHQVLQAVKSDPKLEHIPVLMLTSSERINDIQSAYNHNAEGYLRKPTDLLDYLDVVAQVRRYWRELPNPVKRSLFWVNTPAHPRQQFDSPKRIMGIPTPLKKRPNCALTEVERYTTASLCKLVQYVGDDSNSYYEFVCDEGTTWVANN